MLRLTYAMVALMVLCHVVTAQQSTAPNTSSILVAGLLPGSATTQDAEQSGTETSPAPPENRPMYSSNMFIVMKHDRPVLHADLNEPSAISSAQSRSQLKLFAGARFGEVIQLHWITTSEAGTMGFEIERRSQLSNDWRRIGYIRRDRGHTAQHAYSFLDQLRGDGVSYYRLRQIGLDGYTRISPVITVTPDQVPHSFDVWQHSINPFQNYGTVAFGLDENTEVKLSVIDRYGNTVAVLLDHVMLHAGHHVLPFGTYMLEEGLYTVRITSADGCKNLLLMNS